MTLRSGALKTAALLVALLFGFALRGRAQSTEGYVEVFYDEFSGGMRAFAITYADYDTLYYYVPQVHVMFMKEHDYYPYNVWLGEDYGTGGSSFDYALASVSAEYEAGVPYDAFADHSIDIYFYDEWNYGWYDFYGYGLLELPYPWDLPRFEVWVWAAPIIAVYEYIQSLNLGQTAMENVVPPAPTVSITSASIPDDTITVQLAPQGISGTLTVQLVQGGTTHTVYEGTRTGGTHNISFNIPNLPNGEFSQVRATWAAGGQNPSGSYNYHIRVLGNYVHTKYNTPNENYCTGSSSAFLYTDGQCLGDPGCNDTSGGNRKNQWFAELWENGSGYHSTLGYMSREWACTTAPARQVPNPCPECGGSLNVGQDVAVQPNHPYLSCGDSVYVYGVGTRTVRDKGGLAEAQLDHYIGTTGCNKYGGSYGTLKTIKLY